MQFIDFKKEHFTKDEEADFYCIDLFKEEIGFGEIKVEEKKNDGNSSDIKYELNDDIDKITIKIQKHCDIRVYF
ncbi:hypothetical protein [Chryseobacterium balustinum]|jgi:phage terminase large subunit-like protein|uniref:hypothetical protein n=1 Tax=Chryseobacterium balustinum TaxID=246 RepID=UPI003CECAFA6